MSDDRDKTCNTKIVKWVLDTRNLWCIPGDFKAREEVQVLRKVASRALNLLSGKEQESVLRYYHVKDAKMSLASFLLKHLVITKYMSIPWTKSLISIDRYGKPYLILDDSQPLHLDFNVSHQAGVVILFAAITNRIGVKVGTDIVCVNERRQEDYKHIDTYGFFNWLSIFEEVLADLELSSLRGGSLSLEDVGINIQGAELTSSGKDILDKCERRNQIISLPILINGAPSEIQLDSNVVIDIKLRQFYASWCLRESYIKMTGEALSAPWLKDLEILQVKAPKPSKDTTVDLQIGEKINTFAINLKSKESKRSRVTNVTMDLTSLGLNYLVAGTICTAKCECVPEIINMGEWQILDVLKDVIEVAEANLNEAIGV
ncbi:4'-phosphopantetheinyl transferase NpgA [Erysiphe neolycopersici]|uniref:holo-[acyl-carrier-protein] synthase n=1 Tax=Erysiphe neolycopersici TaxID=212602 RepID=A0A420HCP4_9PEZI|nr:4'-phosphopantetheinyl transferase NpgA [Erysiphe neolycopersici]